MISIIIVHHGRDDVFSRTEKSLSAQIAGDKEFVIIKSDSPPSKGFDPVAWNRGIRQAKGEILILNKPETISYTNSIEQHRQWHQDKKDIAVFSTVFLQNGMREIGSQQSLGDELTGPERHAPLFYCGSIRKETMEKVRGFDEKFAGRIGYCDSDLANRLSKVGVDFKFDPKIIAVHQYVSPADLKGDSGKPLMEENHKNNITIVNPDGWGGEKI